MDVSITLYHVAEDEDITLLDEMVVIATLDNDQQNLLARLLAHRLGADRTVAVVDTVSFSDLFEAVGVDVAGSQRKLSKR